MYEKHFITQAVQRSATTEVDRRKLFTMLGIAGAGAAAATVVGGTAANAAPADTTKPDIDLAVLNFALNLEYLEAEFYLRAVYGHGLENKDTTGTGRHGGVTGGHKVHFKNKLIEKYATEIAKDEKQHVLFLRSALSSGAVSRPSISLDAAFTAAARAAGVVGPKAHFNAFANDTNFLLASFLFEDVGVTAYKGAAALLTNPAYLTAAAGILAVEAYHAGIVRTSLYAEAEKTPALFGIVQKLSNARDFLDGKGDDDQGIGSRSHSNLVPTDKNSIVYSRSTGQVLNIVYLNTTKVAVTKGGFYPHGVNGVVNTSIGTAS